MDVATQAIVNGLGTLCTLRVIRQKPVLRVKVSASLEDVNSRQKWLQEILDTAPEGMSWICLNGGFETYTLELQDNDEFEY